MDRPWSSPFLWIAANVIIIWLVISSYRHHKTAGAAVSAAMDDLFLSSEHDVFVAAPEAVVAPVLVMRMLEFTHRSIT
jgi:hypothetical protein